MIFALILPRPDDAGRERMAHYMTEAGAGAIAEATGALAAAIEELIGQPCGVELCGNVQLVTGRPFFTLSVMPRRFGTVADGIAISGAIAKAEESGT